MDQNRYTAAMERTNAKLRYAAIHLGELRNMKERGNDAERAHQESFLFQLYGVRDAFLQELNIKLDCGISIEKVNFSCLKKEIKKMEINSTSWEELKEIETDENSWLSCLSEMRHHSTHRHSIPRLHHMGGENHGEIHLANTKSGLFVSEDYIVLFGQWHTKMKNLITQLRNL